METDRRNKAKLSPPSATEDQHSDERLEHHQQTDKQILVRRDDRTPGSCHPAEMRLVADLRRSTSRGLRRLSPRLFSRVQASG